VGGVRRLGVAASFAALLALSLAGCSNTLLSRLMQLRWGSLAYVANETDNTISAYNINQDTGALLPIPGTPFACGKEPSALAIASGTFLYAANAGDNTVSGFRINADNGSLEPVVGSPFPAGLAPNVVTVNASGKFLFVGNSTGVSISGYAIDSGTGTLTQVSGSPYSTSPYGVRSFAVMNKFLYAAIGNGSVRAYEIDPGTGVLTTVAESPFAGSDDIDRILAINVDGKCFLYGTSSVNSKMFTYGIDWNTGVLTPLPILTISTPGFAQSMGLFKRVMAPSPFLYVAHWDQTKTSGSIAAYSIDRISGALTPVTGLALGDWQMPASLSVGPGNYLFVANTANNVLSYHIDDATGALTPVPGSPFSAGAFAASIATTSLTPYY
jgi:6-phosphogluconolactonase